MANTSVYAVDFDIAEVVSTHNKWRTDVGVEEQLSYSAALAKSAQAWADNLKKTNHCQMRHSKPDGKYGENLYWGSALQWSDGRKELQKVTPQQVVDAWGSEKTDYDYATNDCKEGKMCGHYTQVVWRITKEVGCAMSVCEDSQQQVWVCHYQPPGNWVGEKPY
ncbi:MAG: CAP domain-containing protein [Gallionella sp.]